MKTDSWNNYSKQEKANLIKNALANGKEYKYEQIAQKIGKHIITTGGVSLICHTILKDEVDFRAEMYGDKPWQIRIWIKLKPTVRG